MALSRLNFLASLAYFLFSSGLVCEAATVNFDFDISWVTADPIGGAPRSVIGINGQWPLPPIFVTKGDRVIINAYNGLKNETTSLHMHGIFMNGSTHMDGAAQVSQCAIPPGGRFTYNFTVTQPGTYWYHSHVRGQYPDGLRAPLIVDDLDSPYQGQYDEEMVLTVSDWYHSMASRLLREYISYTNPTGAEPVPNAALMNDTQNLKIKVQPGKTYLFRIANLAAFAAQYLWFEGHTMRIVEVDGVYTQPMEANMLYITAAQRWSVLVTMKNDTGSNFAVVGSMDMEMFDRKPHRYNPNVTSWLVYDDSKPLPAPAPVSEFTPPDDFDLVPHDRAALFDKVDHSITMDMGFENLGDGANYGVVNGVSYVLPKVPTLYTALSSGLSATNAEVYGTNTNAFVLNKGDIVEIILNNKDKGKHPFHLHGHNFQLVSRSESGAGAFASNASYPAVPMRRDTVFVRPDGNIVLRFRADNPGCWLFHCHLEWHTASGLVATMIEAPLELQSTIKVPADHWDVCQQQAIPTAGNAAGNTIDLMDLRGENTSPPPLPAGFTAKGIVALVFSVISAFCGVAVIAWYGAMPAAPKTTAAAAVPNGSAVPHASVSANSIELSQSEDAVTI